MSGANEKQVGGTHYSSLPIQPWEAMSGWGDRKEFLGYLRYSAIAYLARVKENPGEDAQKAEHYCQKLAEERVKYEEWKDNVNKQIEDYYYGLDIFNHPTTSLTVRQVVGEIINFAVTTASILEEPKQGDSLLLFIKFLKRLEAQF